MEAWAQQDPYHRLPEPPTSGLVRDHGRFLTTSMVSTTSSSPYQLPPLSTSTLGGSRLKPCSRSWSQGEEDSLLLARRYRGAIF